MVFLKCRRLQTVHTGFFFTFFFYFFCTGRRERRTRIPIRPSAYTYKLLLHTIIHNDQPTRSLRKKRRRPQYKLGFPLLLFSCSSSSRRRDIKLRGEKTESYICTVEEEDSHFPISNVQQSGKKGEKQTITTHKRCAAAATALEGTSRHNVYSNLLLSPLLSLSLFLIITTTTTFSSSSSCYLDTPIYKNILHIIVSQQRIITDGRNQQYCDFQRLQFVGYIITFTYYTRYDVGIWVCLFSFITSNE